MSSLDAHDRELVALSTAKNNLETFIYDIRDKLEHDSKYRKALTSDEKSKITEKLTETDAWLWEDGTTADVKVSCFFVNPYPCFGISFSIDLKIETR